MADNRTTGAYITFTDYRRLIRELNKIDPQMYKDLRKDIKTIAKPMASEIRKEIPLRSPLGSRHNKRRGGAAPGFDHSGRTAWRKDPSLNLEDKFKPYPVRSVYVQTPRTRRPAKGKTRSLLRVRVNNVAVSIADMAGRASSGRDGGLSRSHQVNLFGKGLVTRRYRIRGQGKALVTNLTRKKGSASRFAWKAAERKLPETAKKVEARINKSVMDINRKMQNG